MEVLGEGTVALSIRGLIATSDSGHGSMVFLETLVHHGIGVIMIFPDHLIRSHPFVGKSDLKIGRGDDGVSDTPEEDWKEDEDSVEDGYGSDMGGWRWR